MIHGTLVKAMLAEGDRQYVLKNAQGGVLYASAKSPQDAMAQLSEFEGVTVSVVTDRMRSQELLKQFKEDNSAKLNKTAVAGGKEDTEGSGTDDTEA